MAAWSVGRPTGPTTPTSVARPRVRCPPTPPASNRRAASSRRCWRRSTGEWDARLPRPVPGSHPHPRRADRRSVGPTRIQRGGRRAVCWRPSRPRARSATTVVTESLLDYGEARMRAAIEALPDGEYRFERCHGVGRRRSARSGWRSRIEGGSLTADFDGTSPQIEGNINAVEAVTRSCLYYAVRVATDPTIPANGGCYRPLRLIVPGRKPGAVPVLPRRWPPATSRPANGSPTRCWGRWPRRHRIGSRPLRREP